jgi:hypothetical protein
VMQHLLVHQPWEAKVGGPAQFRWMYSQERELKKLRVIVRNKERVEGCIAEAFVCKEITNFSIKYFSRGNNVNDQTMWYHIVAEVPLSELSIFQWKNMEEVQPNFEMFDKTNWKQSGQPTLKHGVKGGPSIPKWFRLHVIFASPIFFISNCRSSITRI